MFEHRDDVVALQGEPGVTLLGEERAHVAIVLGGILGDSGAGWVAALGGADRGVERLGALRV
jgi:hypothetical protein